MFKSKRIARLAATLILISMAVSGCKSQFEKLRASNDTARKYQTAIKLYNDKKYNKALVLFDDLVQKFRGRAEAEDLYFYFAYTNFYLKDYLTARHQFRTFVDNYPSSPRSEEARYMVAYCLYLESPVYSLDQSNTLKAIEALQLYINYYPQSERAEEAAGLIEELRSKLERKSFETAKLFLDMGDYQAAVISFENSQRDYPDTKFDEEISYLTAQAQYLYAKNSSERRQTERYNEAIEYVEEYLKSYPDGQYIKDASKIKSDAQKGIKDVQALLASWEAARKENERLKSADEEAIEESNKNPLLPQG